MNRRLRQTLRDVREKTPTFRAAMTWWLFTTKCLIVQPNGSTFRRWRRAFPNCLWWFFSPDGVRSAAIAIGALFISWAGFDVASQQRIRNEQEARRDKQRDIHSRIEAARSEMQAIVSQSIDSRMGIMAAQTAISSLRGMLRATLDASFVDTPMPRGWTNYGTTAAANGTGSDTKGLRVSEGSDTHLDRFSTRQAVDPMVYDIGDSQLNESYMWQGHYMQSELQINRAFSLIRYLDQLLIDLNDLRSEKDAKSSPWARFAENDYLLLQRERIMLKFSLAVLLAQNGAFQAASAMCDESIREMECITKIDDSAPNMELHTKFLIQIRVLQAILCVATEKKPIGGVGEFDSRTKVALFDALLSDLDSNNNGLLKVQKQLLRLLLLALKAETISADYVRPCDFKIGREQVECALRELRVFSAEIERFPGSGFMNLFDIYRSLARSVIEECELRLAFKELQDNGIPVDTFDHDGARAVLAANRIDTRSRNDKADVLAGVAALGRTEWQMSRGCSGVESRVLAITLLESKEQMLPQALKDRLKNAQGNFAPRGSANGSKLQPKAQVPSAPEPPPPVAPQPPEPPQ